MTPKEINDENLEKASGGTSIIGNNRQQKRKREENINRVLEIITVCPECEARNSMELADIFDPEVVTLKCTQCKKMSNYKWERFGL